MRLIDADVLVMNTHLIVRVVDDSNGMPHQQYETVIFADDIDDTPTVDAVPVVRCKDCANAMYTENGDLFCDGIRDANWFCADGEKKVTP